MIRSIRLANFCVALALSLVLLAVAAQPVIAANIYIDYTCTLKEALKGANRDEMRDECEAGSGDDTIIFTRDDKPRSGELPTIDQDLVIDGRGHKINANHEYQAFKVEDAHLTIRDVKIRFDSGRNGPAFRVTDGKLTLINVVVENCGRGIRSRNSHVTIAGNSDVCGLGADEIVDGSGTTDISLPAPLPVDTCSGIGAGLSVAATYGNSSGVQCTLLGAPGIGVQSVVDAGFISAVNLWGYVEQGVEVCFPQLGSLVFIDSANTPRTASAIAGYRKGNSACARVTRAGTVVLMPGDAPTAGPPVVSAPAEVQPAAGQPSPGQPAPGSCPIHTTGHLRLRAAPSLQGETIGYVPRGSNLNAISRTTYWYQVSYLGQTGWIGQLYVSASC